MYTLILLMAGSGTRLNLGYNKLLYKINQQAIYQYTLANFTDFPLKIILVVSKEDYAKVDSPYLKVIGGNSRACSVKNALAYVDTEYVLIHDAARVLTPKRIIKEHLEALKDNEAVITLTKCYDSVKNLDLEEVDRSKLLLTQTPLSFKTSLIKEAYEKEVELDKYLDDFLLFKKYFASSSVKIVNGSIANFKLTDNEDLEFLERILKND